jgi:hypothetical protein
LSNSGWFVKNSSIAWSTRVCTVTPRSRGLGRIGTGITVKLCDRVKLLTLQARCRTGQRACTNERLRKESEGLQNPMFLSCVNVLHGTF